MLPRVAWPPAWDLAEESGLGLGELGMSPLSLLAVPTSPPVRELLSAHRFGTLGVGVPLGVPARLGPRRDALVSLLPFTSCASGLCESGTLWMLCTSRRCLLALGWHGSGS